MQRRIFQVDGLPFVAARDGFVETHGTLAALIREHRPGATTDRCVEADAAPMQEAAPTPGQVASRDTGTSAAVLRAPAPAELDAPRPNTEAPSAKPRKAKAPRPNTEAPSAKPRKAKAPRSKPPPASTDAAPTDETAVHPSEAAEMLAAVEATQDNGPKARVVGRRRAGQSAPPRWTIAGKMRRGRLT